MISGCSCNHCGSLHRDIKHTIEKMEKLRRKGDPIPQDLFDYLQERKSWLREAHT